MYESLFTDSNMNSVPELLSFIEMGKECASANCIFYFQGRILNINVTAGIIITNQSLVLQGVSRTTAGNYTCVGHNTEGDGESEPFFLNVLCKYKI